jgi:GntR family transcriptional regulator
MTEREYAGVETTDSEQRESAIPGRRPLYAQVKDLMIANIVSGRWKPGQILPSEIVLASEFAVSQGTVRKALNELEAQYLVVRRQGRGTFVSEHTPQRSLFHFFHIVGDDGQRELPTSVVVSQRTRRPTNQEAQQLRLEPGALVHAIVRLRNLRGRPIILERLCLPTAIFPDLELPVGKEMTEELYVIYQQRYQVMVARAREALRGVAADDTDAQLLQVVAGSPLLEIERIAYDLNTRPVELRIDRCNTAHHHYFNQLE